MQTIQDWEDARFAREAADEIDAIPTAEPARTIVAVQEDRPELVALCGRVTAGLSVQLLTTVSDEDVRAFVTLDVNGRTETIEVQPGNALDAYHHPYVYGATLPL